MILQSLTQGTGVTKKPATSKPTCNRNNKNDKHIKLTDKVHVSIYITSAPFEEHIKGVCKTSQVSGGGEGGGTH